MAPGVASPVGDDRALDVAVPPVEPPVAASTWAAVGSGRLADSTVHRFVDRDWSFADADNRLNLHPYPARYVLDLPAAVIDILKPTLGVIDPFCGSGTTLEASAVAGVPSVGVDLNPIACLLSRVRVGDWIEGDDELAQIHRAGLVAAATYVTDQVVQRLRTTIPNVDHWFEPWAQRLLAGATEYVRTIERTDPWHDRVALSVSATIVKLSRQDSDTRYAAVDKRTDMRTGLRTLNAAIERTASYLASRPTLLSRSTQVLERDARDLSPVRDESLDAAVFSPPYPNAYEYWLYHKYRMYWLQHDPISVRESEIGARPHYFKSKDPHTEEDFGRQMGEVFQELGRVLRPSSPVVIVVGDSVIRGQAIDNRALLFDAASAIGFTPRAATWRHIRRGRSSFNSAHGSGRAGEHMLLLESPA